MAASLTVDDVRRLLSEPSASARADLADKVSAALTDAALTPREVALAHDIVRILAWDVEERVRARLSHALRRAPQLPRDVALKLADDIDSVALPILADALVLSDDDLIEIIRRGSAAKQEAIASRPGLGEPVAEALTVHAGEPAILALMRNRTAWISETGLNRVLTRFRANAAVNQAMVQRDSLPLAVAERLATMVSKELQDHLLRVHALPPGTAADLVIGAREQAVIRLSAGASDEALQRTVAQMQGNGRLTPTLLLRALCTGDIAFFEAAMAAKGEVPLENAQRLIHDPGRQGLAALHRKAGLPERMLPAVRAAVDAVAETGFDGNPRDLERYRARVISRILTCIEAVDADDADYLLGKLDDILAQAPRRAAQARPAAEMAAG